MKKSKKIFSRGKNGKNERFFVVKYKKVCYTLKNRRGNAKFSVPQGEIMQLQESGEMYLECILRLSREIGNVRSIDIGEYRGFSKPSISRAMKHLKEGGFINVDENGFITLTESGRAVAEKIYERHTVLSDLFERLGVPDDVAAEDACRIEHVISDESFAAIKRFIREEGDLIK